MAEKFVWRVVWHRVGWTGEVKSRTFERKPDAKRFLAKLTGDERPDLGLLDFLRVDRRPVGEWQEVYL